MNLALGVYYQIIAPIATAQSQYSFKTEIHLKIKPNDPLLTKKKTTKKYQQQKITRKIGVITHHLPL